MSPGWITFGLLWFSGYLLTVGYVVWQWRRKPAFKESKRELVLGSLLTLVVWPVVVWQKIRHRRRV